MKEHPYCTLPCTLALLKANQWSLMHSTDRQAAQTGTTERCFFYPWDGCSSGLNIVQKDVQYVTIVHLKIKHILGLSEASLEVLLCVYNFLLMVTLINFLCSHWKLSSLKENTNMAWYLTIGNATDIFECVTFHKLIDIFDYSNRHSQGNEVGFA